MVDDTSSPAEIAELAFMWVEDGDPALGGQWMRLPADERSGARPVALAEAVEAHRAGAPGDDPLVTHVAATSRVVAAAGDLEDAVLPDLATQVAWSADAQQPQLDRSSPEGERVRRCAEALHKLAADLAELVEEQLDGGSLAALPEGSTSALCQATQTSWRLRHRLDPPGPLYL